MSGEGISTQRDRVTDLMAYSRYSSIANELCSYHKDQAEKQLLYKTRPGYESRNRCSLVVF